MPTADLTNLRRLRDDKIIDVAKPAFGAPISAWTRHLAAWPVRSFDGRWTWLRMVERRRIQKYAHLDRGPDHWWQYRWTF